LVICGEFDVVAVLVVVVFVVLLAVLTGRVTHPIPQRVSARAKAAPGTRKIFIMLAAPNDSQNLMARCKTMLKTLLATVVPHS
jgi:hypothetical protein